MINVSESKKTPQTVINKTVRTALPNFPDEYTSPYWVWPPLTGYDILQTLLKHTLRPRPRQSGMWIITVQDEWRCFSKVQWHYTDASQAREAFRTQIHSHLQGSPVLSTQRCIAVAQGRENKWYLWQIVHEEPSFAMHLTTTLQDRDVMTLTTPLLEWITRYVNIYQQCAQYPVQLDLSLDNIGVDDNQSFIYLGPVEAGISSPDPITKEMIKQIIEQLFTLPILQNLPVHTDSLRQTLKNEQSIEKNMILESLIEIFSNIEEA